MKPCTRNTWGATGACPIKKVGIGSRQRQRLCRPTSKRGSAWCLRQAVAFTCFGKRKARHGELRHTSEKPMTAPKSFHLIYGRTFPSRDQGRPSSRRSAEGLEEQGWGPGWRLDVWLQSVVRPDSLVQPRNRAGAAPRGQVARRFTGENLHCYHGLRFPCSCYFPGINRVHEAGSRSRVASAHSRRQGRRMNWRVLTEHSRLLTYPRQPASVTSTTWLYAGIPALSGSCWSLELLLAPRKSVYRRPVTRTGPVPSQAESADHLWSMVY